MISDLRLLALPAETHQRLALATVRLELEAIELRLPRINLEGMESGSTEAAIVRKLDKVIADLRGVKRRASVEGMGRAAAWVAKS